MDVARSGSDVVWSLARLWHECDAQTTLVFVHGKSDGVSTDSRTKVINNYWTPDMIRAATRNYTVPYEVVFYDGRKHYWDCAVDVARKSTSLSPTADATLSS